MHMMGMPKNFIGTQSGNVYSWGDSASVQTSSGTAVTFPQATERTLSGLNVYGHSTQDGTPSPDNPVPIVSAGDSGEIEVSVGGGQLIKPTGNFPISGRGVTLSQNADGSFHLSGTATSDGNLRIVDPDIESYSLDIKEATLSLIAKNGEFDGTLVLSDAEQSWTTLLAVRESNKKTGQVKAGKVGCFVIFTSGKNYDVDLYPMLNIGSTALSFEPYVTPQTLILSTPDGLPGIPVSSGGNYTDESGQQWVCDEVDFARGVYVQRVGKINVNLVDAYDSNEGFGLIVNPDNLLNTGLRVPILSNYFQFNKNIKNDGVGFAYSNGIRLYYTLGSVEAFNEWLSQNDVVVYYPFATPIETPLSSEQISAYKALHTYSPTTTVSNDAEAWMEVGYRE